MPVPPSVSRVVEVHLPVRRTGRIAQRTPWRCSASDRPRYDVGAVVARQVQVAVGRHPVQRPARGREDQLRPARFAQRAALHRAAQQVPRAGRGVQGQRRARVVQRPRQVHRPARAVERPQARQRETAAQVHRRVGGRDRPRVAPGVGRGTGLVAQVQRGVRGRDRGGVRPRTVERQRRRPPAPSAPDRST